MEHSTTYDTWFDDRVFQVKFGSTLDNIDRAVSDIKNYLATNHNISKPLFFIIHLLLLEGLTNAVKHGNKYAPDKTVDFFMKLAENSIHMEITDMGEGFSWEKFEKNNLPTTSDHGRGLHIIGEYSSEFFYNKKGNKLTIVLNRNP